MSDLRNLDFNSMTVAEFEQHLPELFASGDGGKLSEDPRLAKFLKANPTAPRWFAISKPSPTPPKTSSPPIRSRADSVWSNIASKLEEESDTDEPVDLTE